MINMITIERIRIMIKTGTTEITTARATTAALAPIVAAKTRAATTAAPVTSVGPATTVVTAFYRPNRFPSLLPKLINSCLRHYRVTSNGDRGSTDIHGSPDTWTAPATSVATATTEPRATTNDEARATDSSAAPAWRCTKQRRL